MSVILTKNCHLSNVRNFVIVYIIVKTSTNAKTNEKYSIYRDTIGSTLTYSHKSQINAR